MVRKGLRTSNQRCYTALYCCIQRGSQLHHTRHSPVRRPQNNVNKYQLLPSPYVSTIICGGVLCCCNIRVDYVRPLYFTFHRACMLLYLNDEQTTTSEATRQAGVRVCACVITVTGCLCLSCSKVHDVGGQK